MRKIIAVLLAVLLALAVTVVAFAASGDGLPGRGDLNGDKSVNIRDMQTLYDYLYHGLIPANLPYSADQFPTAADLNNDGAVDILDYQALYLLVLSKLNGGGSGEWSPYV